MIDEIIEIIQRFPTGDNCQPWTFEKLSDSKLKLTYSKEKARHEFNRSNLVTRTSIGFLKSYLKITSEALGLTYTINERDFNLIVVFKKSNLLPPDKTLYKKLLNRTSDRRNYDLNLNSTDINLISSNSQAEFRLYEDLDITSKSFINAREKTLWTNKVIFKDFIQWVRLSFKEYKDSEDGMLYKHLNIKWIDTFLLRFLRRYPFLTPLLFKTPLYAIVGTQIQKLYKDSCILFYPISKFDQEEIDLVTHKIIVDWINMQELGFSYHPMNIIAFPLLDTYLYSKDEGSKIGLEKVKRYFKLPYWPIWVARIGKCKKPYPHTPSIRR
jgi:hypothetical protein